MVSQRLEPAGLLRIMQRKLHFLESEFSMRPNVVAAGYVVVAMRYVRPPTALHVGWDWREEILSVDFLRTDTEGKEQWDRMPVGLTDILIARGADSRTVRLEEFVPLDRARAVALMDRVAADIREFRGDLLRGDWSIEPAVAEWHASHRREPGDWPWVDDEVIRLRKRYGAS